MKQLTANLEGVPLSWALAVALGRNPECKHGRAWVSAAPSLPNSGVKAFDHTDPALCLGLIKQYRANIDQVEHAPKVQVTIWYEITDSDGEDFDAVSAIGDTIEQAVARCVVQMRLGDEVDVPNELCEQRKEGV